MIGKFYELGALGKGFRKGELEKNSEVFSARIYDLLVLITANYL